MKIEKRRYKRFIVDDKDIRAKTSFAAEIEILDISVGGARIKGTRSLKIGSKYVIKIERGKKVITLKCRVIWEHLSGSIKNERSESIPVYTAGIEFTEIFSDRTQDLLQYLKDYTTSYEMRLTGVRISFHGKELAIMNHEETYIVKKISLGGMLIESHHPLPERRSFPMELAFPQEINPIKFQGKVACCMEIPEQKPNCYDIGISFFDMSPDDKSKLDEFIQSL
jgi:hypothetical protein